MKVSFGSLHPLADSASQLDVKDVKFVLFEWLRFVIVPVGFFKKANKYFFLLAWHFS